MPAAFHLFSIIVAKCCHPPSMYLKHLSDDWRDPLWKSPPQIIGVDARLAPTAPSISIGKSSKSSHIMLLSSESITSDVVAGFNGFPVDINILVAVEKVINENCLLSCHCWTILPIRLIDLRCLRITFLLVKLTSTFHGWKCFIVHCRY